jgi:hypothetical protein
VLVDGKGIEPERVAGHRSIDGTLPGARIHRKGFAVAAVTELIGVAAPDVVVIVRVKREKHANAAIRVGVQHHQEAVVVGADLDLAMLAADELAVVVQFDPDRRVLRRERDGGRRSRNQK